MTHWLWWRQENDASNILPVAVARSSSENSAVWYVLLVLWARATLCFRETDKIGYLSAFEYRPAKLIPRRMRFILSLLESLLKAKTLAVWSEATVWWTAYRTVAVHRRSASGSSLLRLETRTTATTTFTEINVCIQNHYDKTFDF